MSNPRSFRQVQRRITPRRRLSRDELRRFCDFLQRRTGMMFGESKRYYIDRRVAERMAAIGDAVLCRLFPAGCNRTEAKSSS